MVYPNFYKHKIIFSKSAEKFLDSLNENIKRHILEKINLLRSDCKNLNIKKLKSHHVLYRLRVGNFRIIYSIKSECLVIYIIAIGYRRDIYKHSNFA